jgi:SecD/SecF fusion protein
MNKKPVMFRLVCAIIIIAVFAFSIYPLKPLDFYSTLKEFSAPQVDKTLSADAQKAEKKKMEEKLLETIKVAKQIEKTDKTYPSVAIEKAANKLGTDLTKYVVVKGASGNRDVISFIKMKASSSIRLGIDLNGGVEFLLEVIPASDITDNKGNPVVLDFNQQREAAIEVLRNRLESENIFEAEITPVGDKFVSLKVPTTSKDEIENIRKLLMMSARLEFRAVHPDNATLVTDFLKDPIKFKCPAGYVKMKMAKTDSKQNEKELIFFVKNRIAMRGKNNIAEAFPTLDNFGQRMIILRFTPAGSQKFAKVTTELAPKAAGQRGQMLGIVLDSKLYSAPAVNEPITGGSAQITGSFSREEAGRISKALVSGNLPKMKIEAMFETDPTLGAQAVKNGTFAGIIGLLAVVAFMVVYYMRAGVVASIAVAVNIVLIMGFMATFRATLTLPGIAGIILTIGMAVDANVLIFERIREELLRGKNLLTSIDLGYSRAFITIFDANITTLFVALILMWQGSGPVKGFAVTLAIGIVTSMFTSLFLTRVIFDIMGRLFQFKGMKMMQIFKSPKFNFLGMKKFTLVVSVSLIVISFVVAGVKGVNALGIDFTGGARITYNYTTTGDKPSTGDILKVLDQNGYESKVSYKQSLLGGDNQEKLEVQLRERNTSKNNSNISLKAKVKSLIEKNYPAIKLTSGSETSLGGLIGLQFAVSAIIAMALAILGIIVYISIRFEFAFAIASIIALMHDITIATGLFILSGYFLPGSSGELSLPVIAALLTIMGYSLNDTIVVFDRIREDLTLIKDKSYKEIINISINQTLSRTVLTSVTTLIVLVALYVAGVVAINDFVLVMIIGVVVGTYSSIFIASPIVSVWHKRIGAHIK